MLRKTSESVQLNLYASPESLFSGKSLKLYEDKTAWHNQFRQQITIRIDESLFSPLFCANNGTPNAPVRILVAMMVLKDSRRIKRPKTFRELSF